MFQVVPLKAGTKLPNGGGGLGVLVHHCRLQQAVGPDHAEFAPAQNNIHGLESKRSMRVGISRSRQPEKPDEMA